MAVKAYFEITNACNLSCDFCHGTKRKKAYVSESEFRSAVLKLRGYADYLYFHLMGEPLLHPKLKTFLDIAAENGFKVILTTNGTLIKQRAAELFCAGALHKVSISLHCYEANDTGVPVKEYLDNCFDFCAAASEKGIITVMRLWNIGGKDAMNSEILDAMHTRFPGEWKEIYSGYRIKEKIFLEWGEKFAWPDENAEYTGDDHYCYGLRDQIGILCDGTVVPCCLDSDGVIALGNIFDSSLEEILGSPRAIKLKKGFESGKVCEELCKRCGYAARFTAKK